MKEKLERIFEKLNFSHNEIKILVAVFANNPISIARLTQKVQMTKSSVYEIVDHLLQEGFLLQEIQTSGKTLRPVTAEKLLSLIANRQRKMRRLELEVEELIPEIIEFSKPKEKGKLKVKLHTGEEELKRVIQEVRKEGKVRYTIGSDALFEIFPSFATEEKIEKDIIKNLEHQTKVKKIVIDSPLTENVVKSQIDKIREVKKFPPHVKFKGALTVYNNKVLLYSQKGEIFVVEIEDESIAEMMKSLFEFMWRSLNS